VEQYVEADQLSYQQAAAPRGVVRGYVTPKGQPQIDERALHRTTVWRWAMFLGAQLPALQTGMALHLERQPLSTFPHFAGDVSPRKHRSQRRRDALSVARRLLRLLPLWEREFSAKLLPRFATRPPDS
jgi:hypothetical protein